ncbi:asparagine synthase-related protein [Kitasatospora sp. NPDC059408]|uniref:asparagine synthase-related protein n=1 Tax=Kitasatospora sp. NPDC059408 TaxID=3346823 RepID=UPI00369FD1D6
MSGHGTPFFFAFPDSAAACAVARRLCADRPELDVIPHASGRPWIVGHWSAGELLVVRSPHLTVALIGTFGVTAADLARRVAPVREPAGLDRLGLELPGQFHLLAATDGAVRVQGTAYGTRRIAWTRIAGTVVAGDRAAELARFAGAGPDLTSVALRLLNPLPAPFADRAMWHGVRPVPPGHCLELREGLPPKQRRWHRPPEPVLGLAEAARDVRSTLTEAVALRTADSGLISADLSGGLDSTSLCFLAAGGPGNPKLIACTATGDESENDDGHWARLAAERLVDTEHFLAPASELPLFYSGAMNDGGRHDTPVGIVVSRDRVTHFIERMAERGSRLHLTGNGGDHLFLGSAVDYHALLPTRPLLTLAALRGYRTLFGWSRRAVAGALLDRRSYRRSFAALTTRSSGSLDPGRPSFSWLHDPVIASWFTLDCLERVEQALAEAAPTVEPLAATRGRHHDLAGIHAGTQEMRGLEEMGRLAGVPVANPYFDDRVVDAALGARPELRATPWAYKPLLVEAMRGIVPDRSLARRTKGDGSPEATLGLYRHREELAAVWEDSALARAGLVDPDALRRLCRTPGSPELAYNPLTSTLACEAWLRTA